MRNLPDGAAVVPTYGGPIYIDGAQPLMMSYPDAMHILVESHRLDLLEEAANQRLVDAVIDAPSAWSALRFALHGMSVRLNTLPRLAAVDHR